jgi:hypothetical protein
MNQNVWFTEGAFSKPKVFQLGELQLESLKSKNSTNSKRSSSNL